MMNTRFKTTNKVKIDKITKLWSQIFAVMMNINRPLLQTILYLNENFEDIYEASDSEEEVYKYIFDELGIKYSSIRK